MHQENQDRPKVDNTEVFSSMSLMLKDLSSLKFMPSHLNSISYYVDPKSKASKLPNIEQLLERAERLTQTFDYQMSHGSDYLTVKVTLVCCEEDDYSVSDFVDFFRSINRAKVSLLKERSCDAVYNKDLSLQFRTTRLSTSEDKVACLMVTYYVNKP